MCASTDQFDTRCKLAQPTYRPAAGSNGAYRVCTAPRLKSFKTLCCAGLWAAATLATLICWFATCHRKTLLLLSINEVSTSICKSAGEVEGGSIKKRMQSKAALFSVLLTTTRTA